MKIDGIDVYHIALPLKENKICVWRDKPWDRVDSILVRLRSGDVSGWGEASPGRAPLGGPEYCGGAYHVLSELMAHEILADPKIDKAEDLTKRLAPFKGNRFAKAAIDTAWWDLKARIEGRPLHALLGGSKSSVEVGPSFDRSESIEPFLEQIGQALEDGFARVELKFRPGWDIAMLNAVRGEYGAATIHIDVEGELSMNDTDTLYRLDDFGLAFVEQPLAPIDLVGHAMLQDTIRTPIGLDESIASPESAEMAIDLKCCRYINLEPGKTGGLTAAQDILGQMKGSDIKPWTGVRPQSALGTRAALALASRKEMSYPSDYFPASELLEFDLAESPTPQRLNESGEADPSGTMRIPLWDEPGLGIEPDPELLERACVKKSEVRMA